MRKENRFFYQKIFIVCGGKIFSIFELVCFRNVLHMVEMYLYILLYKGNGYTFSGENSVKTGSVSFEKRFTLEGNILLSAVGNMLVQEGQLSVSGERICTILVNRLVD